MAAVLTRTVATIGSHYPAACGPNITCDKACFTAGFFCAAAAAPGPHHRAPEIILGPCRQRAPPPTRSRAAATGRVTQPSSPPSCPRWAARPAKYPTPVTAGLASPDSTRTGSPLILQAMPYRASAKPSVHKRSATSAQPLLLGTAVRLRGKEATTGVIIAYALDTACVSDGTIVAR